MGNSNQVMPKVDFKDEKLKTSAVYKKYLENKNIERATVAKKLLFKKRLILATSFAVVIAIYSTTILKIKQETFLDDFEEPPRIIKTED